MYISRFNVFDTLTAYGRQVLTLTKGDEGKGIDSFYPRLGQELVFFDQ